MKNNRNQIFIIILLLALVAVIASSCDPQKRMQRRCAACPIRTEIRDSTIIEREIQTDTIYKSVTVTTTLPNPCQELCDENGKLRNGIKKVFPSATGATTLITRNDSLIFTHQIDSLREINNSLKETIKRLVTITEQVPARCERDCLTEFERVCLWVGKISLAIVLIALVGLGIWVYFKRR